MGRPGDWRRSASTSPHDIARAALTIDSSSVCPKPSSTKLKLCRMMSRSKYWWKKMLIVAPRWIGRMVRGAPTAPLEKTGRQRRADRLAREVSDRLDVASLLHHQRLVRGEVRIGEVDLLGALGRDRRRRRH